MHACRSRTTQLIYLLQGVMSHHCVCKCTLYSFAEPMHRLSTPWLCNLDHLGFVISTNLPDREELSQGGAPTAADATTHTCQLPGRM